MDPKYRITAGLIGAIGLAALGAQLGFRLDRGQTLATALWSMTRFFTILTNLLMAATMLTIAATGRRLPFGWMSMLTMSMIMVGLVYHLFLAGYFSFVGRRWWIDQALHTILPALMLWFWLMETARNDSRGGQPLLWLAWPAIYAVYALARGALGGRYPYPFLDISRLGAGQVAVNMVLLVAAFAAVAVTLNAVGKRMPGRDQPSLR